MAKKSKRKSSVKSSLLVLLLILILLISSTYAWFTANLNVKVSTLDVHVDAANGIQISTDAANWKTVIGPADITDTAYAENKNQLPANLVPVSTDGDLANVTSEGMLNMYLGTLAAPDGTFQLTAKKEDPLQEGKDHKAGKYIAFDMFLKVTDATDVYLSSSSSVVPKGDNDKGLQNSARVAFIDNGNAADGSAAGTYTALKGKEGIYMWEPNNDKHTANAISNASGMLGKPDLKDGTAVTTYGVSKDTVSPIPANQLQTATEGLKAQVPTLSTKAGKVTLEKPFIHLDAGITKVRVYMWVEGQDVDCENTASGTDISFNLNLEIKGKQG